MDPETGQEYHWREVVAFEDEVPEGDRPRLLAAIRETAILREAVFLFSKGALIRLSDIPPGGVWIRLLGERHGKSVYRVTIQTRYQGAYDMAINVNHDMTDYEVLEEIHWLIVSGASQAGPPLVEDFGGYWAEHGMWSEEFISGEPLSRAMLRLSRRDDEGQRLNDQLAVPGLDGALGLRRLLAPFRTPLGVGRPRHEQHRRADRRLHDRCADRLGEFAAAAHRLDSG